MTTAEIYDQLLNELDRSLIVDDKTRDYWLANYKTLPVPAVAYFLDQLKKANQNIDHLVAAGIDANPGAGEEIIQKIKAAKKMLNKFREEESQEEENPEEFLQSSLT